MTQANGQNLLVQGRIVWVSGDLFEGKPKLDFTTKQPVMEKDGVTPAREYGFGLAIPKVDPATGQNTEAYVKAYQALHGEAMTLFPGGNLPPDFAIKYKDGDTAIDQSGKKYSEREGWAGHIVISCTTRIPPKFFVFQGGNNVVVNEGIKCGDYVNVQLNVKAHAAQGAGKAGLYVNPTAVQLIQPGQAIINSPSGDQIFGEAAPAYAGNVVADQAPAMPQVGAGAPPMPGQAAPQPGLPQNPTPQAAPANYDVLPGNLQPQPGLPQNPAPTAAPVPGNDPYAQQAAHMAPPAPNAQAPGVGAVNPPVNNGGVPQPGLPPMPQ
jgi:hypothetical protein